MKNKKSLIDHVLLKIIDIKVVAAIILGILLLLSSIFGK
jgi:hypothetical protein